MIFSRIKKKIVEAETRPVVLHKLPGRIRFGIKVLKRLRKENLPLAEHLKSVLEEIPAVNEIIINNISGSLLIAYDTDKTDSEKVRKFLQDVIRYLLGYADDIMAVSETELPVVLDKLSKHIKSFTGDDLTFMAGEIPEEVWKV